MNHYEILHTKIKNLKDPIAILKQINEEGLFKSEEITFSTSFGAEDQVLTYLISQNLPTCEIFTLDTGRLFQETYDTFSSTVNKYKLAIKVFSPDANALSDLYAQQGANGFYETIENRKNCCGVRKIQPLKKALAGKKVWITGLRAEQSDHRGTIAPIEYDSNFDLIKIHPLLYWSWEDVLSFIEKNGIPVNPLHKKGFPSIGCAPCTRAISEGEDFRAGRWWWEQSKKECGLHA
jgi:phosphoadenosine phosphosulfate reductase